MNVEWPMQRDKLAASSVLVILVGCKPPPLVREGFVSRYIPPLHFCSKALCARVFSANSRHPPHPGRTLRTVSSDYIASAITSLTRFSAERPQSLVTGARGGVQACRDATSRGNIDKRRAPRNSVRPSVGRSIEIRN